jgi:hypothetical protein
MKDNHLKIANDAVSNAHWAETWAAMSKLTSIEATALTYGLLFGTGFSGVRRNISYDAIVNFSHVY